MKCAVLEGDWSLILIHPFRHFTTVMPADMGSDVVLASTHYNCPHMHKFPPPNTHIIKIFLKIMYKIRIRFGGDKLGIVCTGGVQGLRKRR